MLWWNEQDQAGEGRRGHVQHKPGIPLEAASRCSSAPSPHVTPAAGLVDLSQAAAPTKGNLQMAQRIWDFSILMFAASIPLGDSFFWSLAHCFPLSWLSRLVSQSGWAGGHSHAQGGFWGPLHGWRPQPC